MRFVAVVDCAHIVVRRLEEMNLVDPFSYHLYIGGAFNISWFMKRCAADLSKNGFKVCLKYDLLCLETEVIPNMKYSIGESFRCILLLTTDFGKDAIDIEELKWLNKKKNKFNDDAVLVFNFTNDIICEENFKEIKMLHNNVHEQNINTIIEECMQLLQRKRDLDLYKVPRDNIGIGEAFGYFYGYLRIILPNMRTKFYEKALNNDEKLIKNAAPRYLIIVPEDCKGKIKFDEDTGWFVVTAANRAGVRSRDYKSSVQKITDEQGEEFYFVGEFSTPTVTMYESYIYGKYGLTLDELYQGRNTFFLTLQTLLNEHPETKDSYRLLFWRNINPENGEDFRKLLLKVLKEEIGDKENKPQGPMVNIGGLLEIIDVPVANPKAIYEKSIYPRSFQVRGLCLSFVYSKSILYSGPRNGYEKDKDYIFQTFQRLQFEVRSYEDLKTEELKTELEGLKKMDWNKYGCVACCFASHGCSGNILTVDSPISMRCITEYFYDVNCPGLKGKPKLFFIQACLADYSSQDNYKKIEKATLAPGNPDVLISYSCLDDALSYRSALQGSLYLQALHECLQPNLELKGCLDRTNDLTDIKVQKSSVAGSKCQKPFYVTSLNKSLYL